MKGVATTPPIGRVSVEEVVDSVNVFIRDQHVAILRIDSGDEVVHPQYLDASRHEDQGEPGPHICTWGGRQDTPHGACPRH